MTDKTASPNLVELAADVVSAYVSNNSVPRAELVELIGQVHASLVRVATEPAQQAAPQQKPVPAVPIKKSVMPDYIISLEDGRKFKSLKRHLRTTYNMTPDQYRAKWGLPPDYPMVAPNYSSARSNLAKEMGLGRKRTPSNDTRTAAPAPAKRPRRAKTKAA